MSKKQNEIGLIGLAVMGQNIVMNMAEHGHSVSVYNRTYAKTENFLKGPAAAFGNIQGSEHLKDFVETLQKPRKIMMMIKAGEAVDHQIQQLLPCLEEGDILIDGGNSHYTDTNRRQQLTAEKGIRYVGMGVSGGEEGARRGPSLMPGGDKGAWPAIKTIFQDIAAKVDGTPCCQWLGSGGSGHFVKMVHNGIEYGDMQLICEAYSILKDLAQMDGEQMSGIFADWNKGELDSYLIEITSTILNFKDDDGSDLLPRILDAAGQKGTGKWTSFAGIESNIPVTLITEAVYSRLISALKEDRVTASDHLEGPKPLRNSDPALVNHLQKALTAAKIISYAQGFMLLKKVSDNYDWKLNFGDIALLWRGGCIIRSVFLNHIKTAFDSDPTLSNLMLDPYFRKRLNEYQLPLRKTIAEALLNGIALPAFSAALSFYDSFRSADLPANLLQAQRDFFGAHTYERTDRPRGEFFHTNWTGMGGKTSSTTYDV